jgi:hypothetical protein
MSALALGGHLPFKLQQIGKCRSVGWLSLRLIIASSEGAVGTATTGYSRIEVVALE